VRLSRAAAASSAVPGVLSPVTLNNYGGTCGYQYPSWVGDLAKLRGSAWSAGRMTQRYREMEAFQNSKDRPFIHLVDGGVADNLGLRPVLEMFEELAVSEQFREDVGLGVIRRIVVIVVNARSAKTHDWDRRESPSWFATLQQATSVPIGRYSFESVESMKDRQAILSVRRELQIARARLAGATEAEAEASVTVPKLSLTTLDVSFDAIIDPEERAYFMRLPTSFVLPAEDVDRLREVAGRLMRDSPAFQSVVREFGGLPAK
jgi:NTE family protein